MTNVMSPKSTFDSIDTTSLLSWWRKHFCPSQPIFAAFLTLPFYSPVGMGGGVIEVYFFFFQM